MSIGSVCKLSVCILMNCVHVFGAETPEKWCLDFNTVSVANSDFSPERLKKMEIMIDHTSEVKKLEALISAWNEAESVHEKRELLDGHEEVRAFIQKTEWITPLFADLSVDEEFTLKRFLALGQGQIAFGDSEPSPENFRKFLNVLLEVDRFYDTMGGLLGYHLAVIRLLHEKTKNGNEGHVNYLHPEGMNIAHVNPEVRKAVRWGLEAMPSLAEIYPVGGAGDRLSLIDEKTGEPLPAAELYFCGRTLLEGMIRDLQGREYLYYKLFGKQLTTPIALMTSHEKNNHAHIVSICERNEWFGRPSDSFVFFTQPLVPVITVKGDWSFSAPLNLNVKPGGHGIMWKLAAENKVFDFFKRQQRTKAIVRQINNPVAGTDYGLLAFSGLGCEGDKVFGFAACPRRLRAPEGTNVLVEVEKEKAWEYTLTNIEYTDFAQKGLKDIPVKEGSPYSAFPCNTNILFVDLKTVHEAAEKYPIPGLIINMKTKFPSLNEIGHLDSIEAGRLESTMQNIADFISETTPKQLSEGQRGKLHSFITFNTRRKTISVTKTGYHPGADFNGTPEGCYYETLENHHELLSEFCRMDVRAMEKPTDFVENGPSFIFLFHPALGPVYEVIGQKIHGGKIAKGGEIQLEIAEADLKNVSVEGSLIVTAQQIQYGKCTLKNVQVKNLGIDREKTHGYWKNDLVRKEALQIILEGNGEFIAENLTISGAQEIRVPNGHKVTALDDQGTLVLKMERISKPTWCWEYSFDKDNKIVLKR